MRSVDRSFPEQSLLDVVRDRSVALVKTSDRIRHWTEDRVYPAAFLAPIPGMRMPYHLCAVQSGEPTTLPGVKVRQTVRVGHFFHYEEPRTVLEVGARTLVTVEEELSKTLYSDPLLSDPDTGGHLVERLHRIELFDIESAGRDDAIEFWLIFTATYWLDQNVLTRESFAP